MSQKCETRVSATEYYPGFVLKERLFEKLFNDHVYAFTQPIFDQDYQVTGDLGGPPPSYTFTCGKSFTFNASYSNNKYNKTYSHFLDWTSLLRALKLREPEPSGLSHIDRLNLSAVRYLKYLVLWSADDL